MPRISKPPEVRRKELLDTAMRLFTQRGYDETSMADIARELGVVQGLCYRYFDSKQALFQEAMDQYVETCCAQALPIIHDRTRTIRARMDAMADLVLEVEDTARYRSFYHRPENARLHEKLSGQMCNYLLPHVTEEFQAACESGELKLPHPEVTANYLLYAQVGLMGEGETPLETRVALIRRYAGLILDAEG